VYDLRRWLLTKPWFTSTLLPSIPRPLRWLLRRIYFLPLDVINRLVGDREELVPPTSKIFTGSVDDFADTGTELVNHLVDLGCLKPRSKVLDVGSGMGRLAVALLSYRDEQGAYDGLEIVRRGVEWCTRNITAKHPSYRFELADIYNKEYNPTGRIRAGAYRFPYADDSFDLVVLVSVFTHMLPGDMEHYISEIARVLKPGGHCFATYSLLDVESKRRMHAGESQRRFSQVGPHWVVDTKVPELATAYEESFVRDLFTRHGQSCSVHYGTWSGRPTPPDDPPWLDQDFVLTTMG
jgi:SAM-dependent methyltransferase